MLVIERKQIVLIFLTFRVILLLVPHCYNPLHEPLQLSRGLGLVQLTVSRV